MKCVRDKINIKYSSFETFLLSFLVVFVQQTQLTKMNDYLKNLIESPRLFGISYYFNELRTEIDLSFSLKTDLSAKNVWIQMIQRLDSFEKECLNKHKTDQFNQLDDSENLTQLSIYKQIIKLEKMMFSNKTLIFVNRSPSEALSLERLLVIQNEYIGKSGTDYIKGLVFNLLGLFVNILFYLFILLIQIGSRQCLLNLIKKRSEVIL